MKSKKFLATMLSITMISTLSLIGCGDKKEEGKKAESKVDAQVLKGVAGEPNTLDPAKADSDTALKPIGLLYEGLMRLEPQADGTGKIVSGTAESYKISDDQLKYTFTIRKDAKWSDGQPLTAKDFEYSIKRVADPATASKVSFMINGVIKNASEILDKKKKPEELGVKAIDEQTLEIELEKPCGYFLDLTYLGPFRPVRKDKVEEFGSSYGTEASKMLGNGTFTLKEWTHKNKLVFEKNKNYWDVENVKLDTVDWSIMKDNNAKMQSFANNEIDSIFVPEPDWIAKFKEDPTNEFKNSRGNNIDYMLINIKNNKYLKNEKIRKALAVSFDRENFVKMIWNDQAVPMYGYVTDGFSMGGKAYTDYVKNDFIKQIQTENPDAKKLLLEGLKEMNEPEDPSKVSFRLFSRGTSESEKQEAEFFQHAWKESLGVDVKIEQMDYSVMYDRVEKGDFDLAFNGWFADYNDPSSFLDAFHSQYGVYKSAGWANKNYDANLDKGKATLDPKERAALYLEAEKELVYKDTLIIPVMSTKNPRFVKNYVKNNFSTEFGVPDYKGVYIEGKNK